MLWAKRVCLTFAYPGESENDVAPRGLMSPSALLSRLGEHLAVKTLHSTWQWRFISMEGKGR